MPSPPPKAEQGPQRRRHADGRLLHCCSMCGTLEPWGASWIWWGSLLDGDDARPCSKFCSVSCRRAAGPRAGKVTEAMRAAARAKEFRDPVGPPFKPRPRNYADAVGEQRRRRENLEGWEKDRD